MITMITTGPNIINRADNYPLLGEHPMTKINDVLWKSFELARHENATLIDIRIRWEMPSVPRAISKCN